MRKAFQIQGGSGARIGEHLPDVGHENTGVTIRFMLGVGVDGSHARDDLRRGARPARFCDNLRLPKRFGRRRLHSGTARRRRTATIE